MTTALTHRNDLAIVLDGGGARAAYQVGLLRWLARRYPDLRIPLITGVSAGAINAAYLAAHRGTFSEAVEELVEVWTRLSVPDVFRVDSRSLVGNLSSWGLRLVGGGRAVRPPTRGLVDTAPLRDTLRHAYDLDERGVLTGIAKNLEDDRLVALAIVTSSYTTGRTVAWVQGRAIQHWERPFRHSTQADITIEHVMASGALPLLFPAVQLGDAWYGDGGIRLVTPFSPAIHLGARRILALSTRYARSLPGSAVPQVTGYPPPVQIAGQLLSAIFLDDHDRDALALQRINGLLAGRPDGAVPGLRHIDLVLIRPSRDLAKLAGQYEPHLPKLFRHLMRGTGTRETTTPDVLSLVTFDSNYLKALVEIGEADAEARAGAIETLIEAPPPEDS